VPRSEYQRIDLPVVISRDKSGLALLQIGVPEAGMSAGFNPDWLRRADMLPEDLAWLFHTVRVTSLVAGPKTLLPGETLYRVALDIRGEELAELDWEKLLGRAAEQISYPGIAVNVHWNLVRQSLVRPRALTLPFTLPLRILQVDAQPEHPLEAWVRNLFGSRPQSEVNEAVRCSSTLLWETPPSWPAVEVLHIDSFPWFGGFVFDLVSGELEKWEPVAWLTRWTERWQTRLLVLHCPDAKDAPAARRVAQALCDRGGPAALVVARKTPATAQTEAFFHTFYDKLIHDFALDHAFLEAEQPEVMAALFGGHGREDALRVSSVGLGLTELSHQLNDVSVFPEAALEYQEFFPELAAETESRKVLQNVESDWGTFAFNIHEREGLLPLSRHLADIRQIRRKAGFTTPSIPLRLRKQFARGPSPATAIFEEMPAARFVNSSLWRDRSGELAEIEQQSAGLVAGEICHLAVQIGPKDARIITIGATALFEEVFKWAPEVSGRWIEVAVAGIDFEVIGHPVQELWLPKGAATEPVYFAIAPSKPGIGLLRFGIYFRNNLIQSFRLAAKILNRGETTGPSAEALARALSVAPHGSAMPVTSPGWSTRARPILTKSKGKESALSLWWSTSLEIATFLLSKGPQ
jgi:hypothetical protein